MPKLRTTPLVSVVVTTYRHRRFIERCLQSVLDQGIDDLELIVLDDASPDDTGAVVQPFTADPRVTYLRNETNLGSKKNNGRALQMGSGEYLVWLHGDDFLLPGHLHDALGVLQAHPQCALAYSPCYWVDEGGRVLTLKQHPGHLPCGYAGGRNEFAELLAYDNYITPSSAVMRRAALAEVGTIDQDVNVTAGDWDLFVRLAARHADFAFIGRASTAYRVHPGQVSHDFYADEAPLKAHVGILERALASPYAERLGGHERPVMDHLQRRLAAYPAEIRERYRARAEQLQRRLQELALAQRSRPVGARPKVSVVVPTMNRPELLQDTLASLVGQTYDHWEAVVVNDAGVDVSALAESLDPQGRIRCVRHGHNRGLAAARNTGLRLSGGDIVCYLDDDDRFYPQHLQRVVAAMQEDAARGCVYTEAQYVIEQVQDGRRTELGRDRRYAGLDFSLDRLLIGNYIPVNAWSHRRWLLGEVGLFDEAMPALEDWDLLLRIAQAAPVHRIGEVTVEVRERGGDTRLTMNKRRSFPELTRRVYARHGDRGSAAIAEYRRMNLQHLEAMAAGEPAPVGGDRAYAAWCRARTLTESAAQLMAERLVMHWRSRPSIHVVLAARRGDEAAVAQTLESLRGQLYQGWGLTVLAETDPPADFGGGALNVEWLNTLGRALDEAANAAVADTAADWVALIEPGDRLPPQGLFSFADYINLNPQWRAVYSDSDVMEVDGRRGGPRFYPDFNLELLRSQPYFGNACLLHRATLAAAGGLRRLPLAAGYDAVLRIAATQGEGAVGHVPDVLIHRTPATAALMDTDGVRRSTREAVTEHLQQCGERAVVAAGLLAGGHYIEYRHAVRPPVSIVVTAPAGPHQAAPCIQSLLSKTDYPDYEMLVVVPNTAPDDAAPPLGDARVRVLRVPPAAGRSAMINAAARAARGDYLLLLDSAAQAVHGEWLDRLMDQARRPTVGIVGARLLTPEGRLHHAGMILGMAGAAGHLHRGLPHSEPGYLGRAQSAQYLSAVSGAGLLIRRALFTQLGGLDERCFKGGMGDVDLCLRAGDLGYKVVWTPFASLLHPGIEAAPDAADAQGALALFGKWLPAIGADPAYNRNLRLLDCEAAVEGEIVPGWNPDFYERPRVLVCDRETAAPALRAAMQALADAAVAQVTWACKAPARLPELAELARLRPDVVVVSNFLRDVEIHALELYRRVMPGLKLVFFLDESACPADGGGDDPRDFQQRLARALAQCDKLVVRGSVQTLIGVPAVPEIVQAPPSGPEHLGQWAAAVTVNREAAVPLRGRRGRAQT